MLIVTDIYGNTEGVTGYKSLKRYRNTAGERTLSFLLFPTEQNAHSFDLVQEESLIEFKGELFRIKQLKEKPRGKTKVKEVVAIRKMFDLINSHQYEIHNGSMTFETALQFVLGGTGYTWTVMGTFYAQDFENFGDDNRIALFQEILNRYGSEFDLEDKHFTFKQKIGIATDFQFRYSYNIKTIDRSVNTNNLSTYIKGYGKGVTVEYISPNAEKFINPDSPDGYYHAKPVRDERYTTTEGLLERLKREIQDEPELSITIDFADMRRQGFPYDVPNEGDEVFTIYEPLELDVEARIMEIDEEFIEGQEYPIRTHVTLANFKKNFIKEIISFKQTQKQVGKIMDGSAKLPYSVLDDAVLRATEALQSAQTELEFENGIIARSKDNPNHLVIVTSAGIGVSQDGGATFNYAMTGEGIVADLITVGTMLFDRLYGGTLTIGGLGNQNGIFRILNSNGEIIGDFDADRGGFADLFVANLSGNNVVLKTTDDITYYVSSEEANASDDNNGLSWSTCFRTLSEAIRRIPKHVENNITINIGWGSKLYEHVEVSGFFGPGKITIQGYDHGCILSGRLAIRHNSVDVNVKLFRIEGRNASYNVAFVSNSVVTFENMRIDGNNAQFGYDCGFGGYVRLINCSVFYVQDGVRVGYGAFASLENISGSATVVGLRVYMGIASGYGSLPSAPAATSNLYGQIIGNFSTDAGTQPPPIAVSEKTESWTQSASESWRPQNNGWSAASTGTDVIQGYWSGYGKYYGLWFFGSAPSTAVTGKSIKQIRIWVQRKTSGGVSGLVPIVFRPHGYTSKPAGQPTMLSAWHTQGFKPGEGKWVTLPTSFHSLFANGSAKGIGIYVDSTSSGDYARMIGTAKLEITYA